MQNVTVNVCAMVFPQKRGSSFFFVFFFLSLSISSVSHKELIVLLNFIILMISLKENSFYSQKVWSNVGLGQSQFCLLNFSWQASFPCQNCYNYYCQYSSHQNKSIKASTCPGSAVVSICPGLVAVSLCPGLVAASTCPGQVAASTCPGSAATSTCPGSVAASTCPGSVAASTCPGSGATLTIQIHFS